GIAAGPSLLDPHVATIDPAEPFELLAKRVDSAPCLGVALLNPQQGHNPRHLDLLGPPNAKPRREGGAADKHEKVPPPQAITRKARPMAGMASGHHGGPSGACRAAIGVAQMRLPSTDQK